MTPEQGHAHDAERPSRSQEPATQEADTASIAGDMECRPGCGACCIALSISSPIPGMPEGKPAGVRCVQLTDDNLCRLFGLPERPEVCVRLRPWREMCGETREHALAWLAWLESETLPLPAAPPEVGRPFVPPIAANPHSSGGDR